MASAEGLRAAALQHGRCRDGGGVCGGRGRVPLVERAAAARRARGRARVHACAASSTVRASCMLVARERCEKGTAMEMKTCAPQGTRAVPSNTTLEGGCAVRQPGRTGWQVKQGS